MQPRVNNLTDSCPGAYSVAPSRRADVRVLDVSES